MPRNLNEIVRSWIRLRSTCLYTVNIGGEWSAVWAALPEQPRHQHHDWGVGSREYWMVYGRPGRLAGVWFSSSLPPPPVSKLDWRHKKPEKERQLADGRRGERVWEEPNLRTERKPGPLNHSILSVWVYRFSRKQNSRSLFEVLFWFAQVCFLLW